MIFSASHRAIVAALLGALLAAGCAGVKPSAAPAAVVAPTPPAASDVARVNPTAPAPASAATARPAPAAVPSAADQAPAKPAAQSAAPQAKAPVAPAAPAAKAAPVAKATAPPLDLKALENELKGTKAIGVMTKLSVKNQADDLLDVIWNGILTPQERGRREKGQK